MTIMNPFPVGDGRAAEERAFCDDSEVPGHKPTSIAHQWAPQLHTGQWIVIVTVAAAGCPPGAPQHQQQPRGAPLHHGGRGRSVQAAPRADLGLRPESVLDHQ